MFLFFGVLLLLLPVYLRIAKQKPFSRPLENCLTSYYRTFFLGVQADLRAAEAWVSGKKAAAFPNTLIQDVQCIYMAD